MYYSEIDVDQIHFGYEFSDVVHVLLLKPGHYQFLCGKEKFINCNDATISVVVHTLDEWCRPQMEGLC